MNFFNKMINKLFGCESAVEEECQCNQCNSNALVDIKMYFNGESVPLCQGVSVGWEKGKQARGTACFILYDDPELDYKRFLGKEGILLIMAGNMTKVCYPFKAKILFDEHENFGISVDDIVIETSINFTVLERY